MDFVKLLPKNTRKIQYLNFESYNTNDIKESLTNDNIYIESDTTKTPKNFDITNIEEFN